MHFAFEATQHKEHITMHHSTKCEMGRQTNITSMLYIESDQ